MYINECTFEFARFSGTANDRQYNISGRKRKRKEKLEEEYSLRLHPVRSFNRLAAFKIIIIINNFIFVKRKSTCTSALKRYKTIRMIYVQYKMEIQIKEKKLKVIFGK
jgi:hypothetical protein